MNRSKVYAQILLPTSAAAEYHLATVGMRQEEQWNYFNWLPVCLKRQSPSPACVSYRGPLAKADNYYYKTEGSWINAKQSQRKSRISNRLNERITERKLKEILWTQKTDKKKKKKKWTQALLPSTIQIKSGTKASRVSWNSESPIQTARRLSNWVRGRNSNTGYAQAVKPRTAWTERYFPSLITEKCSSIVRYL